LRVALSLNYRQFLQPLKLPAMATTTCTSLPNFSGSTSAFPDGHSTSPTQSGLGGEHSHAFAPGRLANRRRSSSVTARQIPSIPGKIGPQRTSKVSQKLKILPSPADQDEESGRDVYSQGEY